MRHRSEIMQDLLLLSQSDLPLAASLLLCLFSRHYLVAHWQIGTWAYTPGFSLGFGGSFTTAQKLYRRECEWIEQEEKEEETRTASNDYR